MKKALSTEMNAQELVREYNGIVSQTKAAYNTLEEQEERARRVLCDDYVRLVDDYHDIEYVMNQILEELTKKFWREIISRMKIRAILSLSKKEELDKQLEEGDFPELTVENVHNTIDAWMGNAAKFAQEQIREVYDWLRPSRQKYKSNDPWRVEGRVIKRVLGDYGKVDTGMWSRWEEVQALDKVFHLLDGQPFMSKQWGRSPLIDAINEASESGETEYFRFKKFKNGNVHFYFTRDDLVDEFNRVGGGQRLRG